MATLNDTVTSMRDLIDAIDAFLTGSAGFTQDAAPTGTSSGSAAWNAGAGSGELFVQVDWSAEDQFDIHQSLSHDGSVPGSNPGDSNFPSEVHFFNVNLVNAEVWGFANNAASEDERYAHFVVEFNRDGRFAHFGFGHLSKVFGDWNGGAYKYGFEWQINSTTSELPWPTGHRFLLDSNHVSIQASQNLSTVTGRSLPSQKANGDYFILTNSGSSISQADANGNGIDKGDGFSRIGPRPHSLLYIDGNPNNAFIPLIPVDVFFRPEANNDLHYPVGQLPDVFVCNIGNIAPRDQITLGSDTYQFFPWASKITGAGPSTMGSRNAGVAYKVI